MKTKEEIIKVIENAEAHKLTVESYYTSDAGVVYLIETSQYPGVQIHTPLSDSPSGP